MHLDEIIPEYDKREVHQIEIGAPASVVYDAVWKLDLNQSIIVRNLMRLRGMPPDSLSMRGLIDLGFNILAEDPPRELVIGLAGRFWTSYPELPQLDEGAFKAFSEPGQGKAAWNFLIQTLGDNRVLLRTETRVLCADKKSKRIFSFYWFFIRPFSGWIRTLMLKIIKADAEASVG